MNKVGKLNKKAFIVPAVIRDNKSRKQQKETELSDNFAKRGPKEGRYWHKDIKKNVHSLRARRCDLGTKNLNYHPEKSYLRAPLARRLSE